MVLGTTNLMTAAQRIATTLILATVAIISVSVLSASPLFSEQLSVNKTNSDRQTRSVNYETSVDLLFK